MIEKALCLSTQNDDMRLLSMKKLYESRLNYLINNIWRIEPCHLSLIQFSIDSRIEQTIYSCILDIGVINSNEISTKKCLILINKKQKIFKDEEFKFGIISYSREGNPMRNGGHKNNFTIKIERELKLDDENEEENNEWNIMDLNNGRYEVKMKIKEEGKYLIFVQFNELDIHSSPFEIQVCSKQRNYQEVLHPKLIFGSNGIKNGQFKNPRSVITNSKGNIIVSDSENHRIQVFDSQGQFISTFGEKGDGNGQFYGPYGIATNSKGNIIVSDENNNRIQIFDSEGNFISKFGIEGDGNGQFNHPNGITIDSNGNILVTEWENHRIQIFDSAGKFISKFGEKGSRNGQLNHPNGIAVNSKGDIIVVDQHNHRIQIFDSNGQFISKFGGQGNAKGRFHYPWGIHVDLEGNILIADRNNNGVQVFSPNGEYIAHIREATPVGITIDPKTQNIIVCGSENKISIF